MVSGTVTGVVVTSSVVVSVGRVEVSSLKLSDKKCHSLPELVKNLLTICPRPLPPSAILASGATNIPHPSEIVIIVSLKSLRFHMIVSELSALSLAELVPFIKYLLI